MKTNFSLKTFLPVILLFACMLVVFLAFVLPTGISTFKTYKETGALRKKIDLMIKRSDALEKIDKEDIVEKADKINYYLPSNKDVSLLLDSVADATNQTGLFFDSMALSPGEISTISAQKAASDLPSMEVSISLTGDLASLLSFIKKVEATSPVIRIADLNVSRRLKVSDKGVTRPFDFDIVIVTYYKPLPSTLGSLTEQIKTLSEEDRAFISGLSKVPVLPGEIGQPESSFGKADPFSRF